MGHCSGFVTKEAPQAASFSALSPASASGLAQPPGPTLLTHTVNMPLAIDAACCGMSKKLAAYHRETFLHEMCDAIDFAGQVESPAMFACAVSDPYAPIPPEPDKWSSLSEQVELMRYAIRCRYAKVVGVKGAEHTMFVGQPAWAAYISTLVGWFAETLLHDRKVDSGLEKQVTPPTSVPKSTGPATSVRV